MLGRTPDDAAEPVAVAQRQWCLLQEEVQLKRDLTQPLTQLQETSRSIAETQRECKLDVDTDQYVESFKPFLMDVINAWSKVRSYSASVHLEPLGARLDGVPMAKQLQGETELEHVAECQRHCQTPQSSLITL